LCLEEIELDRPGEVVQGQEEVLVVVEGVEVEWEEHAPGLDPERTVYAPVVELRSPIKRGFPVIT